MKKIKYLSLLLALVLVFVGCQNNQPAAEKPEEATSETVEEVESTKEASQEASGDYMVTDMLGREVTFSMVPEKIVTITPSDAENLAALGGADKIVGIGQYVDSPAEVLEKPVVATGADLNSEEILALEPDLVLMSDMAQTEEQIKTLEAAGVNVLMTQSASIEDVYKAITIIGSAIKEEAKAEEVIASMKSSFEELGKMAEANKGKTIYFEVSPLEYGLWTAGNSTFMNEVAENLGAENIFKDLEGWAEVSEEEVIARNPDYIVTISMGSLEGPTPVEEILGRPGWEGISAVKNKKVLHLQNDELSRPSVRLVEGGKLLGEFLGE